MDQILISKYFNKRLFFHLLFWVFYILFFGLIYGKYGNNYRWYFIESLCMLPFIMLATYVTIYVLLPNYLKKRKLVFTILLFIFLLFFATLGERIFLRKQNSLPVTFDTLFGITFLYLLLETNFMVAIAFTVKMVKRSLVQQKEKYTMEKKNLQTELNLLKAQLHPHFLFNTMNNLYAMSLEKSSKISEGIAKISALLRSVLYDCNESEIPLIKEINLIENYIDLEKMRFGNRLKLEFNVNGPIDKMEIAPMLLFTFIENCFKHGGRNDPENPYININLNVLDNQILFDAENNIPGIKIDANLKTGGIGLQNVKKRLDIIYPNNYDLKISEEKSKFKVQLVINKSNEKTVF